MSLISAKTKLGPPPLTMHGSVFPYRHGSAPSDQSVLFPARAVLGHCSTAVRANPLGPEGLPTMVPRATAAVAALHKAGKSRHQLRGVWGRRPHRIARHRPR